MTKEQIVLQKRAGENMKEYEVIWEIFNKCPRNQMRDVFVDEVEIEDPEDFIPEITQLQINPKQTIPISTATMITVPSHPGKIPG